MRNSEVALGLMLRPELALGGRARLVVDGDDDALAVGL